MGAGPGGGGPRRSKARGEGFDYQCFDGQNLPTVPPDETTPLISHDHGPRTLDPAPCTLHPAPYTLNPENFPAAVLAAVHSVLRLPLPRAFGAYKTVKTRSWP